MKTEVAELRLEAPPEAVWALLSNPADVLRLVPPELRPRRVEQWPETLQLGTTLEFNLRILGLPVLWVMEVTRFDAPELMVSIQRTGPYRYWQHEQRLYPHLYGTILEDQIVYEPMWGLIGDTANRTILRPRVSRWLAYRHMQLLHWFDYGRWLVNGDPAPLAHSTAQTS
jgi:ligand-binding SRPBCC domain-containing protein